MGCLLLIDLWTCFIYAWYDHVIGHMWWKYTSHFMIHHFTHLLCLSLALILNSVVLKFILLCMFPSFCVQFIMQNVHIGSSLFSSESFANVLLPLISNLKLYLKLMFYSVWGWGKISLFSKMTQQNLLMISHFLHCSTM